MAKISIHQVIVFNVQGNMTQGDLTTINTAIQQQVSEIAGNKIKNQWHETWWGIATITLLIGLLVAALTYYFGWA